MADTPSEANHAYIFIKTLFNFAMERKLAAANPCSSGLPYKRGSRDRVLTDPELLAIWSAATDYPFGAILRLLILNGNGGQRSAHCNGRTSMTTFSRFPPPLQKMVLSIQSRSRASPKKS